MNFLRSMLDFTLPVLGLASYPEHPEEEVHRQTDTPADQREEEPQECWNNRQVDDDQQDVDQHVHGSMDVETPAPLNRSKGPPQLAHSLEA